MNALLIVLTIGLLVALLVAIIGLISPRLTRSTSRGKALLKGIIPAILLFVAIGVLAPDAPVTSNAIKPNNVAYKITKDQSKRDIKRVVDVVLPQRIDKATLKLLANKIYKNGFERTFIGYRLQENPNGPYWATTNYTPNLKIKINGATKRESATLASTALQVKGQVIGKWVVHWGYKYKAVIFKNGGENFLKTLYTDGSGATQKLDVITVHGQIRYYEAGGKERGEYYAISTGGELQFWSKNGNYYTAPHM